MTGIESRNHHRRRWGASWWEAYDYLQNLIDEAVGSKPTRLNELAAPETSDPLEASIEASINLRIYKGLSVSNPEEPEGYRQDGHCGMFFDSAVGIEPVSIWFGSTEDYKKTTGITEAPRRMLFVQPVGKERDSLEVQFDILTRFSALGTKEEGHVGELLKSVKKAINERGA